jgi:hypothetical protein
MNSRSVHLLKITFIVFIVSYFIVLRNRIVLTNVFEDYSKVSTLHSIQLYYIILFITLFILYHLVSLKIKIQKKTIIEIFLITILATNLGSNLLTNIVSVAHTPYAPGYPMGDLGVHLAKSILAQDFISNFSPSIFIDPANYPVFWHLFVALIANVLDLNILLQYKEIYFISCIFFCIALFSLIKFSKYYLGLLIFLVLMSYISIFEWKSFSTFLAIIVIILLFEMVDSDNYKNSNILKFIILGFLLGISFGIYFSFVFWMLIPFSLIYLRATFDSQYSLKIKPLFWSLIGFFYPASLFIKVYYEINYIFYLVMTMVFALLSFIYIRSNIVFTRIFHFTIFCFLCTLFYLNLPIDTFTYGDIGVPGFIFFNYSSQPLIIFGVSILVILFFILYRDNYLEYKFDSNIFFSILYSIICIVIITFYISSLYNTTGNVGLWPRSRFIVYTLVILFLSLLLGLTFEIVANYVSNIGLKFAFAFMILINSWYLTSYQYSILPLNSSIKNSNSVNFNDAGWAHFTCSLPEENIEFIHLQSRNLDFIKLHRLCGNNLSWNWESNSFS